MKKRILIIISIIIVFTIILVKSNYFLNDHSTESNDTISKHNIMVSREKLVTDIKDFYQVQSHKKNSKEKNSTKAKFNSKPKEHENKIFKKLKKYIESDSIDLRKLDSLMIAYLKNNKVTRQNKINNLWDLAVSLDSERMGYILDNLKTLQPIELTESIIGHFNSNISNNNKIKLMSILKTSLNIANPQEQTDEQLEYIAQQSLLINNFFSTLIESCEDDEIYNYALTSINSVLSTKQAENIIYNLLSNSQVRKGNSKVTKIDPSVLSSLSIQLAFSSKTAQKKYLKSIIDSFEKLSIENKSSFNSMLYSFCRDSSYVDLHEESLPILQNYFIQNEPAFPSNYDADNVHISMSEYYNWLDGYTNINNSNKYKKYKQVIDILNNNNNTLKQSTIILYSNELLLSLIKKSDKYIQVKDSLKRQIEETNNPALKEIYAQAHERLSSAK